MEHTTQSGLDLTGLENSMDNFQLADVTIGFDVYQSAVEDLKIYPKGYAILYPVLGLNGEAGEVAEKVKKYLRDDGEAITSNGISDERREAIAKELGDVLWYLTATASDIGYDLYEIATLNLQKMFDRVENNTVRGEGDDR